MPTPRQFFEPVGGSKIKPSFTKQFNCYNLTQNHALTKFQTTLYTNIHNIFQMLRMNVLCYQTFELINRILQWLEQSYKYNMERFYLRTVLAVIMIIRCSDCYFIDLNKFASVTDTTTGTVVKTNGNIEKTYYFGGQGTYQSSTYQAPRRNLQFFSNFEYYFGQDKANYVYNLPRPNYSWDDIDFMKRANEANDMQGVKSMYKLLGIPDHEIEGDYVPKMKAIIQFLDYWLSKKYDGYEQNQMLYLAYENILSLQFLTNKLVDTYLKDVKQIIVGSNNRVVGNKIFISTDNMIVNANNTFIYNGNTNNDFKYVEGKNIMRTYRYQFNFDRIFQIRAGKISNCIRIVY